MTTVDPNQDTRTMAFQQPLPSLFISHGSPLLPLQASPTSQFMRTFAETLPRTPSAIVVASAHWETPDTSLTGASAPPTLHDFGGFPPELYKLRYPAPGNPELAEEIKQMLSAAELSVTIDFQRGLDHGAWNPLLLLYPKAEIPVLQISISPNKSAKWHYELGRILSPLRERNIMIMASGNLTHNLREAFRADPDGPPPDWARAFSDWVGTNLESGAVETLLDWERQAPYARQNHPTPEHFLPLFVAMGAGSNPLQATRYNPEFDLGVLAMDAYSFA